MIRLVLRMFLVHLSHCLRLQAFPGEVPPAPLHMPQVVVRMLSGSLVLRPQLLQLDSETEGMICSPALLKVKSSKNSAKESAAISET